MLERRQADAIAYLEGLYRDLRSTSPISLTHKQCVALAGELYRSWSADLEASKSVSFQFENDGTIVRDYGLDLELEAAALLLEAGRAEELDREHLETHLGPLVDRLLLRRGIAAVDGASRAMLLPAFASALAQGMRVRAGKAQGDYRPDPNAERFPAWTLPSPTARDATEAAMSLRGLLDSWWVEAERAGKTISTKESFGGAMETLIKFLEHDDATRVTPLDAVRFKDHLVSTVNPRTKKPLSMKTISGSYLGGLKVVFKWAVENKKLSANPFGDVKVLKTKSVRKRDSWFSPEERKAILDHASSTTRRGRESWQRFEGRRWVPWLCAYSGARVGEMVQLRKEDIRKKDGHWVLSITPEAGTVKAGGVREVPLHDHLLEMGFQEFVSQAPDGHLFMWSGNDRSAWRTAKNRIREEIRSVVSDENIQPNHGWRHTFKTIGREAGIQDFLLDNITGHTPRTEGDKYGGATVAAKVRAMSLFPRYDAKGIAYGKEGS
jgi:integrase